MKNLKRNSLLILLFISFAVNSQIKVSSDGKIGIGTNTPDTEANITTSGDVIFKAASTSNSLLLNFYGSSTFDLSPSTGSGKLGYYKWWNNIYTYNFETYSLYVGDGDFFSIDATYITTSNFYNYSDKRLKKNIKSIDDGTNPLSLLNPVTYEYIQDSVSLGAKGRKKAKFVSGMKSGFVAQEVKEVFPHLVHEVDSSGTLGLDLVGIIPYLVKAYQEQQQEIDYLTEQLDLTESGKLKSASYDVLDDSSINTDKVNSLSQNSPNPFTNTTSIKYSIAEGVSAAQIMVFDMRGAWVNTFKLDIASTELQIDGSTLEAGMYIYSLICDNKEIDTKKMILTK